MGTSRGGSLKPQSPGRLHFDRQRQYNMGSPISADASTLFVVVVPVIPERIVALAKLLFRGIA